MLRGNCPATVDGKGRLKIPAAFKAYLDENYGADYYVTSLDGLSVRIYPFPVWREIEEKLKAQPSMNKSVKKFLDRTNYYGQMKDSGPLRIARIGGDARRGGGARLPEVSRCLEQPALPRAPGAGTVH